VFSVTIGVGVTHRELHRLDVGPAEDQHRREVVPQVAQAEETACKEISIDSEDVTGSRPT
jgi:hypothetical protein